MNIEKKIDSVICDPVIRNEADRYNLRTRLAFLPDQFIGESWFFRLCSLVYHYFFIYFHGFEIKGVEKIDPHRGCLMIARHSTHNGEILGTVICVYHMTGRVLRALIHRWLIPFFPVLRLVGWVPGEPATASSLLKSGFWVAVVPGGAEEGMIGHENAYKVYWPEKRKGFARIATSAGVPIVPIFLSNVEEMRWNPILWLWNRLGLGNLFTHIVNLNIPFISHMITLLASTVWFSATFFQIPIPAKITLHIGDPIKYDMSEDSIDDVVERAKHSLQSLINHHQPNGKSYKNAVRERLECLVKYWRKKIMQLNQNL